MWQRPLVLEVGIEPVHLKITLRHYPRRPTMLRSDGPKEEMDYNKTDLKPTLFCLMYFIIPCFTIKIPI